VAEVDVVIQDRAWVEAMSGLTSSTKTHCINGHPLSGANLWVRKDGRRICAACNRRRFREWYRRTFHGGPLE
jgi:hypothetical protein